MQCFPSRKPALDFQRDVGKYLEEVDHIVQERAATVIIYSQTVTLCPLLHSSPLEKVDLTFPGFDTGIIPLHVGEGSRGATKFHLDLSHSFPKNKHTNKKQLNLQEEGHQSCSLRIMVATYRSQGRGTREKYRNSSPGGWTGTTLKVTPWDTCPQCVSMTEVNQNIRNTCISLFIIMLTSLPSNDKVQMKRGKKRLWGLKQRKDPKSSKETNAEKYHCKGLKSLVLLATSAISGNYSTTEIKYIQNPGQININCTKALVEERTHLPNLKYTFSSIHGRKYYIKVSTKRKIQA